MSIVKNIFKFSVLFAASTFILFNAYIYIAANILAKTLAD